MTRTAAIAAIYATSSIYTFHPDYTLASDADLAHLARTRRAELDANGEYRHGERSALLLSRAEQGLRAHWRG